MDSKQQTNTMLQEIITAITAWGSRDQRDIYAISFLIDHVSDDDRKLAMLLSNNTISHWQTQIARASSAQEAKWNFAFWRQKIDLVLTYSDSEEGSVQELNQQLKRSCVEVAKALHDQQLLLTALGKQIPIIIHTLEYSQEDLEMTVEANPGALIAKFVAWEP